MSTFIEERRYLPTGCDRDDYNAHAFQVAVTYRGKDKWMVSRHGETEQLSQTGKWLWLPAKMNALRWCRFTFEGACAMAEAHVDGVTVNGWTWAQWQARNAS